MRLFLWLMVMMGNMHAAQAQVTMEDVKRYFTEQSLLVKQARDFQDYERAEELDYAILRTVLSYPEDIQKKINPVKGALYYNIACYRSLMNKKEEAIEAFAKAVENGWVNFIYTIKDKDLENIRNEKRFTAMVDRLQEENDFPNILKQAGGYAHKKDSLLPKFTYLPPNDCNLIRIKEHFNLDSIAGYGDELSKIKRLLGWVHNMVRHDGQASDPISNDVINLINTCQKENRGLNCRMISRILNECYLSMGLKSRSITCLPRKNTDDCHVINLVYSTTLDKWLWMDPTFNAYVMDENGNLLNIAEVRERLISGAPLKINEDANWNNKKKETKEHYLDFYMAKNLYSMECVLNSGYDTESQITGTFSPVTVTLYPSSALNIINKQSGRTDNATYFWQSPQQ